MPSATAPARVLDLSGRVPTDAYGLVARVFVDLAPGESIQLSADRDFDQLVDTFRLVWDLEFEVKRLQAGPERWVYGVTRRPQPSTPAG